MAFQDAPLDLSIKSSKQKLPTESNSKNIENFNGHLMQLYERSGTYVQEYTKLNSNKVCVKKNVLPCSVCFKTFDRPSLLKRHMRTHTGEKPHICSVCKKGFSTSSSLNTHRRIHTGEKPHKCTECGKCFTASSNLYYHRMTHTKNKPHKCSMCPRSFPTPGDLRAHRPAHGGAWPHSCPLCARGFAKQTNLRHHLRLHATAGPTSRLFYSSHGKEISTILESLRLLKGSSPMCSMS